MKDKHRLIKTYISEANQNRISETLSVEDQNSQAETEDMSTQENATEQDEAQEGPDEPEALSAPLTPLPPNTGAYEAEAVAGFTIGETYGDQGDYTEDDSDRDKTKSE